MAELLKELIKISEKAAKVARLCRQNAHLFQLLIQKKSANEKNPRFVEDFKTLADVLIQEMVKQELGSKFPALQGSIFGEENNVFCNRLGEEVVVKICGAEKDTSDLLRIVLNGDEEAADLLALEVHQEVFLEQVCAERVPEGEFELDLSQLAIWIDPIDSTSEYIRGVDDDFEGVCSKGLKCVTVLLGVFDRGTKLPVMGVVNQPFIKRNETGWIGQCFWGLVHPSSSISSLSPKTPSPSPIKTICVSSSENAATVAKLRDRGFEIIEASGAGYKILCVITGQAGAYLLSKDTTFKWDTCGPQAILRSLGGDIVVFNQAINKQKQSVFYGDEQSCNCGGIIAFRNGRILEDIMDALST